ncbi:asparagine synthase (glutamine-hydrolyzing) [Ectothiorhodospiraceae bacterium 2226]|nr:asparagine synthase (glutamine-hydrolyzing) [Ectothiorhodospiraceae bacterium 2226]
MCGIAGYMNADPAKPIDPETLVAMVAIQHHRGPDGFGWKRMEDRGVGFSHARLTIVDLNENRGRQPFVSDDGKLMMAHNGEFYDYQRIRADLTSRGARFRAKSDSELVLHLYPRYGLEGMLPHLRGEFAFALYDRERDRLMLVRDRFGVKPLYWTQTGDTFVFGSELKVLFAHPEVPRRFNPQGLYHQLMQTVVPGTTAFDGIQQVQPGCVLIVERRHGRFHLRQEKYWDMDFPVMGERDDNRPEEECVEEVRAGLLEAVNLRLEADVPVGCYLSGGIDSCSIIGLAAACRQDPVKAFTIGFDDKAYDETAIAREMAESVEAEQDVMMLSADHLYDNLVETLWHAERTIYNTLGVAKLLMSRHVRETGYKVVVTGEGSDELFAGYPAFRRDMFLYGLDTLSDAERADWQALLDEGNQLFRGAMLAEEALADPALDQLCGFTPSCLQPWLRAGERVPALMAPELRREVEGYSPGAGIASVLDGDMLHDRHPLDKAQYVWIKTMLEGQILTWGGDRVDMANSMEARPAFLDHHLAEAATQLPPGMRIKGRTEKYVLREAMRGLLPKVLYERQKFAFMAPPAHTDPKKYAAMKALASEFLSDQAIADAGLLDPKGVQELFAVHEDPEASAGTQVQLDAIINHMLGVQILHRHFVATDVPRQARERARELGWEARSA